MIKLPFMRTKPHINLGTIGHVDHGKTSLTSVITKVLALLNKKTKAKSYKEIDSSKEEQIRGITIKTTHVEYETTKRHYAHIDCPGHADYVKNMIIGATQMDGAILVVSASEGPMPQTREHILLAKQIGIQKLIIFINKEDLVPDKDILDLVELEIKALLEEYGFDDPDTPCVSGSAYKALEALQNMSDILDEKNIWVSKILTLINIIDSYIPVPVRSETLPLLISIESIFSIIGRGTVVTGRVERGIIEINDTVELIGYYSNKLVSVISLEMFQKTLFKCIPGDNIGALLRGVQKSEVRRGMVLAKPNSIKVYNTFEAEVYILKAEEGGRKKPFSIGYKPQFFIRTVDITGTVIKIVSSTAQNNSTIILPGDKLCLEIKLLYNIALEKGMRFAIREGGKTIGAGIILIVKS
ncbi:elongation factor Tu, apicoplast-like [Protobothrops mucrosquamatus]|uniref:elongation factor Tu, apicoplast-like n=1 Tax=Protobothrops mucrosquamatus TaxID=103944 RepID=UPI0010FB15FA|nr:elongation factor Tu, apicoplast-like [Protobothrops mucrosquamatus]